jgi:hypothetical protein
VQHDGPRLVVERLDVDPARRRRDRDVAAPDRAVQRGVDVVAREIGAEGDEPSRGELEVVRLGELELQT